MSVAEFKAVRVMLMVLVVIMVAVVVGVVHQWLLSKGFNNSDVEVELLHLMQAHQLIAASKFDCTFVIPLSVSSIIDGDAEHRLTCA